MFIQLLPKHSFVLVLFTHHESYFTFYSSFVTLNTVNLMYLLIFFFSLSHEIRKASTVSVVILRTCRWYKTILRDAHGVTWRNEDLVPGGTFLY